MSQHTTIVDALVAAQAAMETPRFDAVNPGFKSRYATLAEVTRVAKTALNAVGVCISQPATVEDGVLTVRTILLRGTERLELGAMSAPAPAKPQDLGSLCTYLRRYGLSSALAIVADDDDDAAVATAAAPARPTAAPAPATAPRTAGAPAVGSIHADGHRPLKARPTGALFCPTKLPNGTWCAFTATPAVPAPAPEAGPDPVPSLSPAELAELDTLAF